MDVDSYDDINGHAVLSLVIKATIRYPLLRTLAILYPTDVLTQYSPGRSGGQVSPADRKSTGENNGARQKR